MLGVAFNAAAGAFWQYSNVPAATDGTEVIVVTAMVKVSWHPPPGSWALYVVGPATFGNGLAMVYSVVPATLKKRVPAG